MNLQGIWKVKSHFLKVDVSWPYPVVSYLGLVQPCWSQRSGLIPLWYHLWTGFIWWKLPGKYQVSVKASSSLGEEHHCLFKGSGITPCCKDTFTSTSPWKAIIWPSYLYNYWWESNVQGMRQRAVNGTDCSDCSDDLWWYWDRGVQHHNLLWRLGVGGTVLYTSGWLSWFGGLVFRP